MVTATKRTTAPKTEPDEPGPEPEPEAKAVPAEQEERIVDKVVARVKSTVQELMGGASTAGEGDEGGAGEPDGPVEAPASPAQVEVQSESDIREALKRIKAEEDHEAEHHKLKAEIERPPQQVKRLTRALWGEPD